MATSEKEIVTRIDLFINYCDSYKPLVFFDKLRPFKLSEALPLSDHLENAKVTLECLPIASKLDVDVINLLKKLNKEKNRIFNTQYDFKFNKASNKNSQMQVQGSVCKQTRKCENQKSASCKFESANQQQHRRFNEKTAAAANERQRNRQSNAPSTIENKKNQPFNAVDNQSKNKKKYFGSRDSTNSNTNSVDFVFDALHNFSCGFCYAYFSEKERLKNHYSVCTFLNSGTYKDDFMRSLFQIKRFGLFCNLCKSSCENKELYKHTKTATHLNLLLECKNNGTSGALMEHFVYCSDCSFLVLTSFQAVERHLKSNYHKKSVSLSLDANFNNTIVIHSTKARCMPCNKFISYNNLEEHLKHPIHLKKSKGNDINFACRHCDRFFYWLDNWEPHKVKFCAFCEFQFTNHSQYLNHYDRCLE